MPSPRSQWRFRITRIHHASYWLKCMLVSVASLSLASCMVGPGYRTPQAKAVGQWSAGESSELADAYWWHSFNDPVLSELIEIAWRNNLSLQIAGVRVLQARAQLNQAIGNMFPQQQTVSGGVAYSNQLGGGASAFRLHCCANSLFIIMGS